MRHGLQLLATSLLILLILHVFTALDLQHQLLHLLSRRHWAFHPGVLKQLEDGRPEDWVRLHHGNEELLKFVRVCDSPIFLEILPKLYRLIFGDLLILLIKDGSLHERVVLRDHRKEQVRAGENVDRRRGVKSLSQDCLTFYLPNLLKHFWCHKAESARRGLQLAISILAVDRCSPAKVVDLELELVVEQNVFQLHVAVGDTMLVTVL